MTATLIDGKTVAAKVRAEVARRVAVLLQSHRLTPGLAVVLVGDDPASQIYVRNKGKQTREAGMNSFEFKLPADTSEAALLARVAALNADPAVDGILVQMPLPPQISENRIVEAIDPAKDVDGLHPMNAGRLSLGQTGLVPCTPLGCMILLAEAATPLAGAQAIVLGRSKLVGKPMAQLLLNANATVTIAHSRTRDLAAECRRADVVVAAVGKPELVRGDWIKPGAVVIDVGINRMATPDGKGRLVGDVAFAEAAAVARAITPVPGGVGPMTIACLLQNTLTAACRRRGLPLVA
ncbi:MAG: bifunctional methylenetetrahydrofolate dehydrogenase/methenyltetrahydrofolate cyclohydrolase FolD [Alphaproteobacteria bacterium]|nr:bifunctional methylenetetrahydrofolate dehydrogenase/methenyltetrahydrofolate cyclohydrolase FolD [Alphaproteobacteria bacterium]